MMWRVSVSSKTSRFASGGSPIHSTECTNHGLGGFSTYCINRFLLSQRTLLLSAFTSSITQRPLRTERPLGLPCHKKEPVLVGIFDRNESSAPTFVDRRLNVSASIDEFLVVLIDI